MSTQLFSLLLLLAACLPAEGSGTGALRGTVVDTAGTPIPAATVRIVGTTRGGISRQDGTVHITRIPAGSYQLDIRAPGFSTTTGTATIVHDSTTSFRCTLSPAPRDHLTVGLPRPQPPAPGHSGELQRQALHRALVASATADSTSTTPVRSTTATTKQFGALTGTVRSTNGHILVGTTILVERTTRGGYSKGDGTFHVLKIPVGHYTVRVKSLGYIDAVVPVEITAGSTVSIECTLDSDPRALLHDSGGCGALHYLNNPERIGTIRTISSPELQRLPAR